MSDIVDIVATLPFESAMRSLGPITAAIPFTAWRRESQLRLAAQIFGRGPLFDDLHKWVLASPGRLVFDERYALVLSRLLIEHASARGDELKGQELATLFETLLAIGDVLCERLPPDPGEGDIDVDEWTAYTIQNGTYYDQPYVYEATARAYTMFIELARDPELAERSDYRDLDEWALAESGVTLTDQLTAAVALAIPTHAFNSMASLAERYHGLVPPAFFRSGPLADDEARLFAAVSAERDEFREEFRRVGDDAQSIAWNHTAFERRPFLRRQDGTLQLISTTMLVSWMTRGIYFRMLDAARKRRHPKYPHRDDLSQVALFTGFAGNLTERYVHLLVADAHETATAAGAAVVSGEKVYKIKRQTLLSPDVAVAQPPDLVLMEVYSGRVTLDARIAGTPEAVDRELTKLLVKKLSELQGRIGDLLDGHFNVEGMPDDSGPIVWPVLVLAGDTVFQSSILRRWLRRRLPPGAFQQPCVREPTIMGLDDLDLLLALVERGETLPDMLRRIHASELRDRGPKDWVAANYAEAAADMRPRFVTGQADKALAHVGARLFPHSNRWGHAS